MRHIVAKASVRYITGNGTGSCGGTGSNRGNRRTGQHCAVVGGNGAKCTPDKTKTTAGGNVGTTVYNSVPYKGIGGKLGGKTAGRGRRRGGASAKYAAGVTPSSALRVRGKPSGFPCP